MTDRYRSDDLSHPQERSDFHVMISSELDYLTVDYFLISQYIREFL